MDISVLKNLIRVGLVSSVYSERATVRVMFSDKDDGGTPLISKELSVLNRGSKSRKDYWLPDVDEQVVCLFLPNSNGRGVSEGFVLGTCFSNPDAPQSASVDIRRVDFGDGSYVEHDRKTGNLTIHATGNITITGANIYLNE